MDSFPKVVEISCTGPGPELAGEAPVDVSIILPCFNEEGNLEPLARELLALLDRQPQEFEIIFVEDGSSDGSLQTLRGIEARDSRVRVFAHHSHRGQSAAHATGFRRARGEILVTMDSDGQDNPADIPRLLDALRGYDGACGVRTRRRDPWLRRASSAVGNGVRNWLTGVQVADAGCAYRALRREALSELLIFNGMHRFLPTILKLQGYRLTEVEVSHRPRTRGNSKYGIRDRAMRGLVDCLAVLWYRRRVLPRRRERVDSDSVEEKR